MLDIKFIRENPELVKENIRKKFQNAKLPLVDEVIALDAERRSAINEGETLKAERNKLSKANGPLFGKLKKCADEAEKAAIQAELERYLYAAYPRQYPDEENPTNVISVAAIWAAILAAGAAAASVTMTVSGTGAVTRYELANSDLCKLGTITWA